MMIRCDVDHLRVFNLEMWSIDHAYVEQTPVAIYILLGFVFQRAFSIYTVYI